MGAQEETGSRAEGVTVVAPVLTLEVAVERDSPAGRQVHFHAAGQGFWVARMVARILAQVTLCAPLGGEPGWVLRGLVEAEGVRLLSVDLDGWSGVWLSDGPAGERATIIETPTAPLTRHEVDDLYGLALTAGLGSRVVVLTGSQQPVLDPEFYARLTRDLRTNGAFIVCDLSGDDLRSALSGGVDLVKVSDEELVGGGWASSLEEAGLVEGVRRVHEDGADAVLVSRATGPALLSVAGGLVRVDGPRFVPFNHRGAGDSMTAALAAALARGDTVADAARLAAAAAALNVTRRGLGTGDRRAIDRLAARVAVLEGEPDSSSRGVREAGG